jgi:hypothetical protein
MQSVRAPNSLFAVLFSFSEILCSVQQKAKHIQLYSINMTGNMATSSPTSVSEATSSNSSGGNNSKIFSLSEIDAALEECAEEIETLQRWQARLQQKREKLQLQMSLQQEQDLQHEQEQEQATAQQREDEEETRRQKEEEQEEAALQREDEEEARLQQEQDEQAAAQRRKHEEEVRRQREQEQEHAAAQQQREHEKEVRQREQQEKEAALEQQRQQQAKMTRIAELRRQIQEVEEATNAVQVAEKSMAAVPDAVAAPAAIPIVIVATSTTPSVGNQQQTVTTTGKTPTRQVVEEPAAVVDKIQNEHDDPMTPTTKKKRLGWKNPFKKQKSPTAAIDSPSSSSSGVSATVSNKASSDASRSSTSHNNITHEEDAEEVCKGQTASDAIKQKHQWEKPAWAQASSTAPDDTDILTAPIQNGLKTNQNSGYSRRVFAKDIHKVEGNFIAHTKDVPPPRLAWIVVNLDGEKVGKIVMNLEDDTITSNNNNENVDRLVGQFLDLKGLEMERTKDGNLVVKDMDPQLVVTTVKSAPKRRGKSSKSSNVIGKIQEGQEFFDAVLKAGPESIVTIKQAHIYPVKKAKGMFG